MTAKILLLERKNYEQAGIESAVENIFDRFGGVGRFVKAGDKVLLKVNLVSGREPERRVTTDPAVVRAVALRVLSAGGKPVIADSPGIDNFTRAARKAGFTDVARELDIPCVELTDPIPLSAREGAIFSKIEAARLALESDVVINLPKMKTHGQMLLTLGVKNLFGCVVAQRKAEWHYNVGLRRELFASLLLDIWLGIRPALTILDGVVGMDGHGPTNGTPYPYGILAGAEDALALDFQLCRMLGIPLQNFPLWQAAKARNMPQCDGENDLGGGDFSAAFRWRGVNVPRLDGLGLLSGLPLPRFVQTALTSRPAHRPDRCVACGKCVFACKAKAVVLRGKTLAFDYEKCVRCYCCHEMCPTDAICFKEGWILRATKMLEKLRRLD